MRIANFLFAALFGLAVVVQYNDPDPVRWMAMYGAGLLTCVLWERRRMPRALAMAVAFAALGWTIWSALGTHLTAPVGEALTDWQMHAGGSEELREALGLFLVSAWSAALAIRPMRGGAPA